jgi:SAM-dependent methyltransferase
MHSEQAATDLELVILCPTCGVRIAQIADDRVTCERGHQFGAVDGMPLLLEAKGDAADIHESFSREWSHFDHDGDRIWGQDASQKLAMALSELAFSPEEIAGKRILDAGCGHGLLSHELAKLGGHVVAADISDSIYAAHQHLQTDRLQFVQADLGRPPFPPQSFDIVYSGGVLHHNPDTRRALDAIAPLVAPGGAIYVWLYRRVPGFSWRLKGLLRRVIAPLPPPAKHAFVRLWVKQSLARRWLRARLGRARAGDERTADERLVTLIDHYTPRYRWEHTPEELEGWFRELGFVDIRQTNDDYYGFGVLARRPR